MTKGATTIWEHWDGIKPDGSFWSSDMNSFNHYAYGAVADWLYGVVTGINTVEEAPGFEKVLIAPQPDSRLQWAQASIQTRKGLVRSAWRQTHDGIRYEITVPSPAQIVIDGQTHSVAPGEYIFYSENRG
ncbi:MAG: alpha-L-rhamnosidase C-terminal domain-containing protein [Oscillospiraceae bacterium]